MAEAIRRLDVSKPAVRLALTEDDFALKVTSAEDPRFWIRIEKNTAQDVVVTDFTAGGLAPGALVAGLAKALDGFGLVDGSLVVFRDIVPGGEGGGARLIAARTTAQDAVAAVVRPLHLVPTSAELEERRGKFDLRIVLGSATR